MGYEQTNTSQQTTRALQAGAYGTTSDPYAASKRLSTQLEGMIGGQNPFGTPLEQALMNPQYGPSNAAEISMINSLMDITAGRTSTRGLGAPTETGYASAIAPTLVDMYQKNIGNLLGGFNAYGDQSRTNMQALTELISLAMPKGETTTTEDSSTFGFDIK